MSIEKYNSSLPYKVGDLVWIENYFAIAPREDGTYQQLTFICIKDCPPNTTPVIPYNYFPDDHKYEKWIEAQSWEMVWSEWSEEEPYTEGDFATYGGRYYITTWRWNRYYEEDEDRTRSDRQAGNYLPPNENEDEEGVRHWASNMGTQAADEPSFHLSPFSLEPWGDNFTEEKKDKCQHPYGVPNRDENTGEFGGFRGGVGREFRRNGFSLAVYQRYEKLENNSYSYQEGDNEYGEFKDEGKFVIQPSGITSKDRCGVAFQTKAQGGWIVWGAGIIAVDPTKPETETPPQGMQVMWRWSGSISPAPDGTGGQPTAYTQYNAIGHIFYNHNHPLFFRRKVSVTITYNISRQYWKSVKNPVTQQHDYYVLRGKRLTNTMQKSNLTPKDACMSGAVGGIGQWYWMRLDDNEIGIFPLPSGDMVLSEPWNLQVSVTGLWWPKVVIEGH